MPPLHQGSWACLLLPLKNFLNQNCAIFMVSTDTSKVLPPMSWSNSLGQIPRSEGHIRLGCLRHFFSRIMAESPLDESSPRPSSVVRPLLQAASLARFAKHSLSLHRHHSPKRNCHFKYAGTPCDQSQSRQIALSVGDVDLLDLLMDLSAAHTLSMPSAVPKPMNKGLLHSSKS